MNLSIYILVLNTKDDILKNVCNPFFLLSKSVGTSNCLLTQILQNIFCVQDKNTNQYRFGTTRHRVNNDRIKNVGRTIPLMKIGSIISPVPLKPARISLSPPTETFTLDITNCLYVTCVFDSFSAIL